MYRVIYTFTGKTVFWGSLEVCRTWRQNHAYATMYDIRRA